MPNNMALILLLEAATCGNSDFFSAWTQGQTMTKELHSDGPALHMMNITSTYC